MTTTEKAEWVLHSTAEFLATKHGVSVAVIVAALESRNVKICEQFAELAALGIKAMA